MSATAATHRPVGADVVGADVVGADVVGEDVVGATGEATGAGTGASPPFLDSLSPPFLDFDLLGAVEVPLLSMEASDMPLNMPLLRVLKHAHALALGISARSVLRDVRPGRPELVRAFALLGNAISERHDSRGGQDGTE